MDRPLDQTFQNLIEIEEAAEDLLADRRQIIDLDKQRQKTREAIRALPKDKTTDKAWLCFGDMFIKLPKRDAKQLLDKDYNRLDDEISSIRNHLKVKVDHLRDLENKNKTHGFDLNPLSREEMRAMQDLM